MCNSMVHAILATRAMGVSKDGGEGDLYYSKVH